MKIAILTQPLGRNYGGIMQAYALQKVLRSFGHEVVVIDRVFYNKDIIKKIILPFNPIIYKFFGRKISPVLSSSDSKYIYSGMTDFIDKNINMSRPIKSSSELKSHYINNGYDLVVVGSDQVWRPKYSPDIYNFFVDFIGEDNKSITYAASFGVDDWEFSEKETLRCKSLVRKFNAVSVRESSALKLCREKLDIDAELVLDPTLLVSPDDYDKLLPVGKTKGTGKVLEYILDKNENKKRIAEKVCESLDKISFSALPIKSLIDGVCDDLEKYKYPAVEDWIMSFRDADFVVTDSFHGCVFSIIFNKSFIVIGNNERGLARFQSLLSIFDLMDRLVLDFDSDLVEIIDKEINWNHIELKLDIYREKSNEFLRKWM